MHTSQTPSLQLSVALRSVQASLLTQPAGNEAHLDVNDGVVAPPLPSSDQQLKGHGGLPGEEVLHRHANAFKTARLSVTELSNTHLALTRIAAPSLTLDLSSSLRASTISVSAHGLGVEYLDFYDQHYRPLLQPVDLSARMLIDETEPFLLRVRAGTAALYVSPASLFAVTNLVKHVKLDESFAVEPPSLHEHFLYDIVNSTQLRVFVGEADTTERRAVDPGSSTVYSWVTARMSKAHRMRFSLFEQSHEGVWSDSIDVNKSGTAIISLLLGESPTTSERVACMVLLSQHGLRHRIDIQGTHVLSSRLSHALHLRLFDPENLDADPCEVTLSPQAADVGLIVSPKLSAQVKSASGAFSSSWSAVLSLSEATDEMVTLYPAGDVGYRHSLSFWFSRTHDVSASGEVRRLVFDPLLVATNHCEFGLTCMLATATNAVLSAVDVPSGVNGVEVERLAPTGWHYIKFGRLGNLSISAASNPALPVSCVYAVDATFSPDRPALTKQVDLHGMKLSVSVSQRAKSKTLQLSVRPVYFVANHTGLTLFIAEEVFPNYSTVPPRTGQSYSSMTSPSDALQLRVRVGVQPTTQSSAQTIVWSESFPLQSVYEKTLDAAASTHSLPLTIHTPGVVYYLLASCERRPEGTVSLALHPRYLVQNCSSLDLVLSTCLKEKLLPAAAGPEVGPAGAESSAIVSHPSLHHAHSVLAAPFSLSQHPAALMELVEWPTATAEAGTGVHASGPAHGSLKVRLGVSSGAVDVAKLPQATEQPAMDSSNAIAGQHASSAAWSPSLDLSVEHTRTTITLPRGVEDSAPLVVVTHVHESMTYLLIFDDKAPLAEFENRSSLAVEVLLPGNTRARVHAGKKLFVPLDCPTAASFKSAPPQLNIAIGTSIVLLDILEAKTQKLPLASGATVWARTVKNLDARCVSLYDQPPPPLGAWPVVKTGQLVDVALSIDGIVARVFDDQASPSYPSHFLSVYIDAIAAKYRSAPETDPRRPTPLVDSADLVIGAIQIDRHVSSTVKDFPVIVQIPDARPQAGPAAKALLLSLTRSCNEAGVGAIKNVQVALGPAIVQIEDSAVMALIHYMSLITPIFAAQSETEMAVRVAQGDVKLGQPADSPALLPSLTPLASLTASHASSTSAPPPQAPAAAPTSPTASPMTPRGAPLPPAASSPGAMPASTPDAYRPSRPGLGLSGVVPASPAASGAGPIMIPSQTVTRLSGPPLIPAVLLSALCQSPLCIQELKIAPLQLTVSLHSSIKVFFAVDGAPVEVGEALLQDVVCLPPSKLLEALAHQYVYQVLYKVGWILGSLGALGNPTGFARAVYQGVSDFIAQPRAGLRRGPVGFVAGVGRGASSLFRHVSTGALQSVVSFTASVGRNAERLTLDHDYIALCEDLRRDEASQLSGGLASGAKGLALSMLGAVAGLVDSSIQSLARDEKPTARTVAKDVGKGLLGLFAKPVGGLMNLVNRTGHGLLGTTGLHQQPRSRPCDVLVLPGTRRPRGVTASAAEERPLLAVFSVCVLGFSEAMEMHVGPSAVYLIAASDRSSLPTGERRGFAPAAIGSLSREGQSLTIHLTRSLPDGRDTPLVLCLLCLCFFCCRFDGHSLACLQRTSA
jgi:hypothetical protein